MRLDLQQLVDTFALAVVAQADIEFVHAENLHLECVHKGTQGAGFYSMSSPAVDALREHLKKRGILK